MVSTAMKVFEDVLTLSMHEQHKIKHMAANSCDNSRSVDNILNKYWIFRKIFDGGGSDDIVNIFLCIRLHSKELVTNLNR